MDTARIEGPFGRGRPVYTPQTPYEIPDTLDYDALAHFDVLEIVDDGGGYNWTEGRLLRSKGEGELFWVVDSGCSCNDWVSNFGQYTTPDRVQEHKVANWQEAVEKAKVTAIDSYGTWNADTVARFAERCLKNEELR